MRRAFLLSALFALAACSEEPPARTPRARRVILVTCDTLRADRLGCYGYERATSPELDRLAREALLFEEAYTSAPWTGPALSALLTGKLPDELGVHGGNRFVLPTAALTVQELARDAGWATGAVVSNWVLRKPPPELGEAGVAQGFQHFDDHMDEREPNRPAFERGAPATTDAALAWLRARAAAGEERFFFWVHYQDPHGPYTPPAEVLARFERPPSAEPALTIGTTQRGLGQIPAYQALAGETRPEAYRARYDAEIAWFDQHLGRLFEGLRALGWWEDSLIVFSADHGESLGEHGYWFCHGENVHREVVRVPLVVRFPGSTGELARRGQRVPAIAGHVDLWPTFLEALGLPQMPNRGHSLFEAALPAERVLVQTLGTPGTPRRWTSASDGRWRLVVEGQKPARLYDLSSDPREEHDRASLEPARAAELAARGLRWCEQHATRALGPLAPANDEASRRAMQGLGYTEGGASDDQEQH